MKRFASASLAIASACLFAASAGAGRARYGGTLHVRTAAAIASTDPASRAADTAERRAREQTLAFVFETLTSIDHAGLRPALATSWQSASGDARWRFRIRSGVRLHDGSILQPWHVETALRRVEPDWKIAAGAEEVTIDLPAPQADLPWTLARRQFAIAVQGGARDPLGTGPFRIDRLDGRRLTLRAHDGCWTGRPFVDAIDVDMGQPIADGVAALERGRVDIAPAPQTDLRRLAQRGLRTIASQPRDIFVLVFEPHRAEGGDAPVRRALAAAIDRSAICTVLLQSACDPAPTLVPRWLSGYAPLMPAVDRAAARAAAAPLPAARRALTIRVEPTDPIARAVADRIAVDGRETGLAVTVQAPTGLAPRPDARLLHLAVEEMTADRVLAEIATALGARVVAPSGAAPAPGLPLDAVYRAERALLASDVVVPIVHVASVYGIGERVEFAGPSAVLPSGAWDAANVWLRPERQP